jgi:hypothetical protein
MKLKQKIENWLLKKIANPVVLEDVIKVREKKFILSNGEIREDIIFFLDGKQISPLELKNIREEIKFIEHSQLWEILTNSVRDIARLKMNERAESFDDMRWGKSILYVIALQEKIINKLKTK